MKQLKVKQHMRDVRALAADANSDKVSGFNFRSDEEVKVFLDEMDRKLDGINERLKTYEKQFSSAASIKIDRGRGGGTFKPGSKGDVYTLPEPVAVTNIKSLKNNFDIVRVLNEQLEVLDTMEAQAAVHFKGERGVELPKTIAATKKKYEAKLKEALKFLSKVAEKHEPTEFSDMIETIMNHFKDNFVGSFSSADQQVFVTAEEDRASGDDKLVFTHYVRFFDLRNESMEYTYPEYAVVFTGVIVPGGNDLQMYVNTLHKFRAPGSFKYGHAFKDAKSGVRELNALFETDDFVDMMDRHPVPLSNSDINISKLSSKDVIDDLSIENDLITVVFKKEVTKKTVNEAVKKVFGDLRNLIGSRTKAQIKYKPAQVDNQQRYFTVFSLILPKNTKSLTVNDLHELQLKLGFDDEDRKRIVRLLNKGH